MLNNEQQTDLKKKIFDYIDHTCIFRCNPDIQYVPNVKKGRIPTRTVKDLTYTFMLRRITHNPVMMHYVSLLILNDIFAKFRQKDEDYFFQFCGMETSSIPLMSSLQMTALKFGISINSFSIRKNRKPYGLFNLVDGVVSKAPVIVVDDLINSGGSAYRCIDVCKHEFDLAVLPDVYSIVTLAKNPFMFKYKDDIFTINSIFTEDDFSYNYDPDKYWLPPDCDKSVNKRPDYF